MAPTKESPFQKALATVEALPSQQQVDLVEVMRRRLAENRRDEIAASIREVKANYRKGRVQKGTLADLMKAINKPIPKTCSKND